MEHGFYVFGTEFTGFYDIGPSSTLRYRVSYYDQYQYRRRAGFRASGAASRRLPPSQQREAA
jgi:hypothetical protein